MKVLALLSLSLAVALALPQFPPGVVHSALTNEKQRPLLGDWIPVQGHVVVEHPGPQVRLGAKEEQEKRAPMPVDMVKQELKAEPEVEVKPDVQGEINPEEKPIFKEQEEFLTLMNLEPETEIGQDFSMRQIDMERTPETVTEPTMELEPLGDSMVSESFQSEGLSVDPLPEGKELMKNEVNVLGEEPIMELEPEVKKEPLQNQEVRPEAAVMEEGPALDFNGDPVQPLEHYFPNEEARMGMELSKEQESLTVDGADRFRMAKWNEESPVAGIPQDEQATWSSYCPGEVIAGKCYQFFKQGRRAEEAEFFCQQQLPGGHLASITNQYIHRKLMDMIRRNSGSYTRTWIGGLRFLKTGRFIWLDGSKWQYADWLSGEPSNTSDLEDCLEVLGNGKFNDFTCWEPQAFICSSRYN